MGCFAARGLSPFVVGLLIAGAVGAAEITFSGGADGTGTDLSSAANWSGGTLPGSEDTGVIDFSVFSGGTEFTVAEDVSLGGIVFTNSAADVTLSGSGTLSLGADGLKFDSESTFTFAVPVEVSAAQTWAFTTGNVEVVSTISGTAALCVTNAGIVNFRTAPGFDGELTCISRGVRQYAKGQVAKKLVTKLCITEFTDKPANHNFLLFGGETRWSDMFTSGHYEFTGWRRFHIGVTNNATEVPYIIMDSDSDYLYQNGPYRTGISAGYLDQRAGRMFSLNYGFTVGVPDSEAFCNNHGTYPVEYHISGTAQYDMSYLFIGAASMSLERHPKVIQNGGTVKANKGVYIGAETHSSAQGCGEYVMSNGTLTAGFETRYGSDHRTYGLVLGQPYTSAGQGAGVFRLIDGDVSAYSVKFGPDTSDWNSNPKSVDNIFALFDMTGGTLNLGEAGFSLGKGWNMNKTNAVYRISLAGGNVNFTNNQTVTTGLFFPPGGTGATLNTGENDVVVDAPISGDGIIRKTGSGRLSLTAANRFSGEIDVREGVFSVNGTFEPGSVPESPEEDCWIWTADSLTNSYSAGDSILSWPDDLHGLAAVDWTNANSFAYQHAANYTYKGNLPVLATNDYFNGHASLHFNGALLQVAADSNPLVGETNFTIAVVLRQNQIGGSGSMWYVTSLLCGGDYHWSCNVPKLGFDSSGRITLERVAQNGGNRIYSYIASRDGKNLTKTVNVALISICGPKYELNVNGWITNNVVSPADTYYPMFKGDSNRYPMPFNIGSHFADSENYRHSNQYISEIRIYKNRTFSSYEQNAIVHELLAKYQGEDISVGEVNNEANVGVKGGLYGEAAPPLPAETTAAWEADDVTGVEDGGEVEEWPNVDGTMTATAERASSPGPVLVKDALNGKSVLRFNGAESLSVAAADSPVSGAANYTVAVVFRTTTDGKGYGTVSWDKATGLISGKAKAWDVNDFIMTFGAEGTVVADYGHATSGYSQLMQHKRPFLLHDGLPHVAVMSVSSDMTMRLMVDGCCNEKTYARGGEPRDVRDVLIGAVVPGYGFFTGDIAAFRLYGKALNEEEMSALSEYYACKYGFRLLPKLAPGGMPLSANGLSATNLNAEAGAVFRVPLSATAPFSFRRGVGRITGDGIFFGSYRYASGSTLDLSLEMADIEDLQISGATMRFTRDCALPWTPPTLSSVSGEITVDVSDWKDVQPMPSRVTLAVIAPEAVDAGTVFTMKGLGKASSVVYDRTGGLLQLTTVTGLRLFFR